MYVQVVQVYNAFAFYSQQPLTCQNPSSSLRESRPCIPRVTANLKTVFLHPSMKFPTHKNLVATALCTHFMFANQADSNTFHQCNLIVGKLTNESCLKTQEAMHLLSLWKTRSWEVQKQQSLHPSKLIYRPCQHFYGIALALSPVPRPVKPRQAA